MKKWMLFLSVYFMLCLLASCGAAADGGTVPGGIPPEQEQAFGGTARPAAAIMTCRVVEEQSGGLLLAEADGGTWAVYAADAAEKLWVNGKKLRLSEPGAYADLPGGTLAGALVEVAYNGNVLETFPAQLGGITAITVLSDGFDDRCALYRNVLEDLWTVDEGLNSHGMTYVGMDLSGTSLSASERSALAWAFASEHGAELVEGTWDQLAEQGYIDREHLQWEDGCLFSITEKAAPFSMPGQAAGEPGPGAVCFDAQKWRSGTGAYYFCDCTSVQDADGRWGGYTVGSEVIS